MTLNVVEGIRADIEDLCLFFQFLFWERKLSDLDVHILGVPKVPDALGTRRPFRVMIEARVHHSGMHLQKVLGTKSSLNTTDSVWLTSGCASCKFKG